MVKDGVSVEIQAVGAGAVNQAVRPSPSPAASCSIGIEIACVPSFADIVIDGEYRTAIRHLWIRAIRAGAAQPQATMPTVRPEIRWKTSPCIHHLRT